MNYAHKIIAFLFLFLPFVLSAQELNLPFHKSRLSKEITVQVESILTYGNYKHDKDSVRRNIEVRVAVLLDYLHKTLKSMVQCDSTELKQCDEFWAGKEVEATERAKKGKTDFLIAEQNLWLVMLSKPSKSMTPYNTWIKYYLRYEYYLEMDIPIVSEKSDFALMLMEAMFHLYGDRFGWEPGKKSLFAKYYNRCSYMLETRVKTLEEYKIRIHLVDSLIQRALMPDSILTLFRSQVANAYHTLAQNYIMTRFVDLGEPQGEETFKLVEQLFRKSLFYKKDARVYYNLALHYYNHCVDNVNLMQSDKVKDKELNKRIERAGYLEKQAQVYFKEACNLDTKYCKYVHD